MGGHCNIVIISLRLTSTPHMMIEHSEPQLSLIIEDEVRLPFKISKPITTMTINISALVKKKKLCYF